MHAEQILSTQQRQNAEAAVKRYFDLLSRYVSEPMGEEGAKISFTILEMFENRTDAPVYNELIELKDKTGLDASCTISDYLLAFGPLSEKYGYTFRVTYDSIVCQPLVEPSFTNDLNALVYVRKHIEGGGISETLTNVIRYNPNVDKLSYIEKASFSTDAEDIDFLLKNHFGYSTAKLNEMAARCFQEKKYRQAFELYEQAAMRDDMNAQYALANMLWKRQGCEEYGLSATINMTKFWLKKIYFKYTGSKLGVKIYDDGIYRPVEEMIDLVFSDEGTFSSNSEDRPFNSGLMKYRVPGKDLYGFLNKKGEIAIPTQYTSASAFSDGLARVTINGKNGYINTRGEISIPAIYENASDFINGTASVSLADTIKGKVNERFFIINKKGEKISEDFDYIGWRDRKEEMLILAKRGNKWGFINGIGKIKVPFIYDNYHRLRAYLSTASDHFVAICQNGKWGFIDVNSSEGKIVVPLQYKAVGGFSFGMTWANDGTKLSFIDKTGKIVCEGFKVCTDFNANGLAGVKYDNPTEGVLINKRGEIVYYYDADEKGKMTNLRKRE